MKIITDAQNAACKATANRISPQKQRQINELRKKIEDKNREICKVRDDTAKKLDDMRKDCNSRQQKEEMKGLVKDFGDLKGTMQKLIEQKKKGDGAEAQLRDELSKTRGDAKKLKGEIEKAEDKCCCPEKKEKDPSGDGYDDDADPLNENGCPVSTIVLRQRARDALQKLAAREQEHCAMCKSRLTCGSGPACPCGTPNPCGGESLQMRKECDNADCAAKGNDCGGSCGKTGGGASSDAKPKTVQVRVKGDGNTTTAEVLGEKPAE